MSLSGSKKLFRPPTLSHHKPKFNQKKLDDDISKGSTLLSKSQINAEEDHSHINLKKQGERVKQKSLSNSQYDRLFDSVITQNETNNKTTEVHSKQNSSQTNQEKQNKCVKSTFLSSLQYDESSSKRSENETSIGVDPNSSQINQEKQNKCSKSYFLSSSKYHELFSPEINQNETGYETRNLNAKENSPQTKGEKQGKYVKPKSLSNSQYDKLFTSVITQNDSNDKTTELNTGKNSYQTSQEKQNKCVKQKSLSNSQYDRLFSSVIHGSQMNCENSEADVPKEHDAAIPMESADHPENILTTKNQAMKEKKHKKYTETSLQEFNSLDLLNSDNKQLKKRWVTPVQKSDIKKPCIIHENVSQNSGKRLGFMPDTRDKFKSPKKIKLTKPNSSYSSQSTSSKYDSISMSSRQSKGFPASQPPDNLNHRERLEWLQKRRDVGVWVQCDRPICKKWRYLCDTKDPIDVPKEWYCSLNPDKEMATCLAPEKGPTVIEEDDLVHNLYTAGSVVWAHLDGYPWWPAMVDDCPDTEQYYWLNELSDIPTHYNVTFFDSTSVSRAWIAPSDLKPYIADDSAAKFAKHHGKYAARIKAAEKQALECKKLDMADRLKKYSFLSRWKGPINTPKDCTKRSAKAYRKTRINNEKTSTIGTAESLLEKSLTNIFDSDDESDAIKQKASQTSLNITKKINLVKEQLGKLSQEICEKIQTQQNIQEDGDSLNTSKKINPEKEQQRKSSQKEVCEKIQTQSQNTQEEILRHDEESKSANKEHNLNESLTQFLEDSVSDLIQNSPILNSLQDAMFSTENIDDDNIPSDCDLFEQNNTQSN